MTDTELYQIVKDHREAWPEMVEPTMSDGDIRIIATGTVMVDDDDTVSEETLLMFEASFHRAMLKRTASVRVESWPECFRVIVQHHEFEAPTLIEAYAKALEWLK